MSILIKNMAMPKNCVDCPLFESKYHFHGCHAKPESFNDMDMWNFVGDRPTWCPLVEVKPHGRLIDADAFRTANGLGEDCENCHRNTWTCNYDVSLSRMDVCGWIDDAPTIIESEEEDG